jgi:hypothetical protein
MQGSPFAGNAKEPIEQTRVAPWNSTSHRHTYKHKPAHHQTRTDPWSTKDMMQISMPAAVFGSRDFRTYTVLALPFIMVGLTSP